MRASKHRVRSSISLITNRSIVGLLWRMRSRPKILAGLRRQFECAACDWCALVVHAEPISGNDRTGCISFAGLPGGNDPRRADSGENLDRVDRKTTSVLDRSMDGPDCLPDMKNAMEWESGRPVLDERFDFVIFICRSGIPGGPELPPPHPWYSLGFTRVASLARVPMMLMWQYYTGDETTPPLLEELPYDGDQTFVEGFTVNTETYGTSWKRFRLITQDDVIDVIAESAPIITRLRTD